MKNKLQKYFKMWPLITIYIVNKNYGNFLEKSIDSVLNQSYENWELFIIDDGSSDNSVKTINKNYRKNNKIKILINPKSIGIPKNANKIIKLSKGEYILRLDSDDWLTADALLFFALEILKNKHLSIIYGDYFYTDVSGNLIGEEFNFEINHKNEKKLIPAHGACTLFKKKDLIKVGGYNENLNAQDGWDIWFKLYKKNTILKINKLIFYYRQHSSSLTKDKSKIMDARTKILRNLKIENKNINCLAIIPIKESYDDNKDVPFIKFENKTLIEHALNSISSSHFINNTIISTSSKKVIEYVNKLKKENIKNFFLVKRPKKISNYAFQIKKTLLHAVKNYKTKFKKEPDLVIYLSLHTIRRGGDYIDQAIKTILYKKYETVISVSEEKNPIFQYNPKSLKPINISKFEHSYQISDKLFRFNGAFIVFNYSSLFKKNFLKNNIGHIETMDKDITEITNLDILKK